MSRQHLFPTYGPPALRFVSGVGPWLTTDEGVRYLDAISGISVNTLGHANRDLNDALQSQAGRLWHLSNMFEVPGQAELARRYCELTFADKVFFTNSGAESVECALKAARRYHADRGEGRRQTIIGFEGAFHGRTYGAMNAAGNPAYLEGFGPPLPGYEQVPFGDLAALRERLSDRTAAVIVEPVQGEGGVRAFPTGQLTELRSMCSDSGALLIYDEVQCGAGRTGRLFAHEWEEAAEPDLMATAKGVGGGFPLGMCLATAAVGEVMVPGTHGTTFGGNALAVAVGHKVLDYLERPEFQAHVRAVSTRLRDGLSALATEYRGVIREIRGRGLLVGLVLSPKNTDLRDRAREERLLVGVAGLNTVRLAPPLNLTFEEADEIVARLGCAVRKLKLAS